MSSAWAGSGPLEDGKVAPIPLPANAVIFGKTGLVNTAMAGGGRAGRVEGGAEATRPRTFAAGVRRLGRRPGLCLL